MKKQQTDYKLLVSPWVLYKYKDLKPLPVGRFRKRNDAEMQLLILKRLMPDARFVIAFSPYQ